MRQPAPSAIALLAALCAAAPARAEQTTAYAPVDPTQFSWQQKPGGQIPLQTAFTNAQGKSITLQNLSGGTPIILDLGYFHCPSLCGVVRNDLFSAIQQSGFKPGRDVTLIAASIDPAETPHDAATAQRSDAAEFPDVDIAAVHYLTGAAPAVSALEKSVGFRTRYDPRFRQFLHPSGLVFLTRAGTISSYVLGVGYKPGDVRAAILRARNGGIARAALPILLLCFHFDSSTGRYTLAITKILRLAGLLTVALIAALLFVLTRKKQVRV